MAQGWPFVGWCTVVLVVLVAILFAVYGLTEHGLHIVIRSTAQTSFVLFISAFVASALAATWPLPLTRWILRNRRYLGVSFAVSHFFHLLAIFALLYSAADFHLSASAAIGGGLAYVFILAMTLTSFDRTAAWIGPRAWQRLHTVGVYYIWGIFLFTYAPRAAQSVAYVPCVAVLMVAFAVRLWARRRPSAQRAMAAAR